MMHLKQPKNLDRFHHQEAAFEHIFEWVRRGDFHFDPGFEFADLFLRANAKISRARFLRRLHFFVSIYFNNRINPACSK